MAYYWARFERNNGNIYRYDTRIYIDDIDKILDTDECIGSIVGKNPGSALPKNGVFDKICEIDLRNDKLLPTVRNLIKKGNPKLGERKYIQVLNLFYLCNPDLEEAIKDYETSLSPRICSAEQKKVPWVWFMWGGFNKSLQENKKRFKDISTPIKFYLDNRTKTIVEGLPEERVCAKHTQGMQHDLVIPYLAKVLQR